MSVDDIPFQAPVVERGVGFFETVLVVKGAAVLWPEHKARLTGSLRGENLPPPSDEALDRGAALAIGSAPASLTAECALRVSWNAVSHDIDRPESFRLDLSVRPIPEATLRRRGGSHAVTLPKRYRRDSPHLKSSSYLAAVLGLRHAKLLGADEGLFVTSDGSYLEGTASALVAWDDGELVSTGDAVLPSVTASHFLAGGGLTGVLSRERLERGAILLGSLTKAAPLLSLDGVACALPVGMLERIARFNDELER